GVVECIGAHSSAGSGELRIQHAGPDASTRLDRNVSPKRLELLHGVGRGGNPRFGGIDFLGDGNLHIQLAISSRAPKRKHSLRQPCTKCRGARYQIKYLPPLIESVEPVMKPASSAARKTTARAISSGSPRRLTGICGITFFSSTSFGTACTISVLM